MTNLTLELPEETLASLQEMAEKYELSTEDLIRLSIEQMLSVPEPAFLQALDYVLGKNKELYKRLA